MSHQDFMRFRTIIYTKVENYGVNPPENSKPLLGRNNPTEDDVVTSLDFKLSLQKLTATEREIIKLTNVGYSKREIASVLNLPDTTVQDTKERAIKKLRTMLNGEDSIYSLFE